VRCVCMFKICFKLIANLRYLMTLHICSRCINPVVVRYIFADCSGSPRSYSHSRIVYGLRHISQ
jgi:hypothetical protein